MADKFEAIIANERSRIEEERERLLAGRRDLDAQLSGLDQELRAIDAYEAIKTGQSGSSKPASSGGNRGTSTRRTGIREEVLAVVNDNPDGISAGDVLKAMKAESKQDKTAVRNALAALNNKKIANKDGLYVPA